jgi:hypothetical protein
MNERIKELADQLGPVATIGNWGRVEWLDNVYPQLGDRMYAAIDLQKFAKLIVSECMDVLDPGENQVIARFQARQWLAEHFGDEL